MKKSFSILIMFAIIAAFSSLAIFMFEIKSIKSHNKTYEYLQLQGNLHLQFLSNIAATIEDDSIESLAYEQGLFTLKIEVKDDRYEVYVYARQHNVRLHKTIIK